MPNTVTSGRTATAIAVDTANLLTNQIGLTLDLDDEHTAGLHTQIEISLLESFVVAAQNERASIGRFLQALAARHDDPAARDALCGAAETLTAA